MYKDIDCVHTHTHTHAHIYAEHPYHILSYDILNVNHIYIIIFIHMTYKCEVISGLRGGALPGTGIFTLGFAREGGKLHECGCTQWVPEF